MAASERWSSEKELTICHTGFNSRNVYHWNAMMSPMEAPPRMFRYPPYHTITTFTIPSSKPHDVQITSSRRCAKSSLRNTVCRPRMYSSSSCSSRRNARTTRIPENVSPTRPSICSASLRTDR